MAQRTLENQLASVTFFNFPWGAPTKAVVEYQGTLYEVRESWGCREDWTNDHSATEMSEEEVERYSGDLTEMSEDEVRESWGNETLQGILAAVFGE